MCKNVFINKYEQSDFVENCKNFLRRIKELKLYIVKFEENSVIKDKIYLFDYTVHDNDYYLIIIIIYNEYIFSTNDRIWKAWTQKRDIFLWPKH